MPAINSIKYLPLRPTLSKICKTWSFHVAVWQRNATKCTKSQRLCTAIVLLIKPFVWWGSHCHCQRGLLKSQNKAKFCEHSGVSLNSISEAAIEYCKTVFSARGDPVIFSVSWFLFSYFLIVFLFSDFFFEMALNAEQAEGLQFVSVGHYLLITGQAMLESQG